MAASFNATLNSKEDCFDISVEGRGTLRDHMVVPSLSAKCSRDARHGRIKAKAEHPREEIDCSRLKHCRGARRDEWIKRVGDR